MRQRIAPEEPLSGILSRINKRILWGGGIAIALLLAISYCTPIIRHYYIPEALPLYTISKTHHDDTLRIAIIGDSWADYHTELSGDTMIANAAKRIYDKPVMTATRGKKGALSKEIYYFMYSSQTEEHSYEPDRCTQPLIEDHPEYCVIFAGINDVTFRRFTSFYAENMRLIIRLLLHNDIRPVVMEIPTVDFDYPMPLFPFRERWFYRIRSVVMGTYSNTGDDYTQALRQMLADNGLKDSILYIAAKQWNPNGCLDNTMFLNDHLHLNLNGYHRLDSCIATEIIMDYNNKKHILHTIHQ